MIKVAFLVVDDRFEKPLPQPFFGTAPTALLQGFEALGSEVEVHVICCTESKLPSPEKLADNIWYHQIELPHWTYLRSGHIGPILGVRALLRRVRPDIIHAQGTERWCAISAALLPYAKVLTIHGNLRLINRVTPMAPRLYWKAQEWLETFSIPRYEGVVCITNYTHDNVLDLARKTWVVPNAVDLGFFPLGERRMLKKKEVANSPNILVIANVQPRKNQNAFIDSIEPLVKDIGFNVRFFGRLSPERDFAGEFTRRIERHSWCAFEGMKGRTELREALQEADLLVLPSLEDNCPMAVIEAMASGVPVIASNVGGVPDLVKEGWNGLLCDPRSAESMREAVKRVFSEQDIAFSMMRNALSDAKQRFHPIAVARKHLEIYREVLGRS